MGRRRTLEFGALYGDAVLSVRRSLARVSVDDEETLHPVLPEAIDDLEHDGLERLS
jgi:hypothetical protein